MAAVFICFRLLFLSWSGLSLLQTVITVMVWAVIALVITVMVWAVIASDSYYSHGLGCHCFRLLLQSWSGLSLLQTVISHGLGCHCFSYYSHGLGYQCFKQLLQSWSGLLLLQTVITVMVWAVIASDCYYSHGLGCHCLSYYSHGLGCLCLSYYSRGLGCLCFKQILQSWSGLSLLQTDITVMDGIQFWLFFLLFDNTSGWDSAVVVLPALP